MGNTGAKRRPIFMEEQAILCLGALTLISSGVELVRLHRGNPLLRGLNLMGQAILVGGLAASFLLASCYHPALQALGTFLILVAFSLCHSALSDLGHQQQGVSDVTKGLLLAQAIAASLQMTGVLALRPATTLASLILAVELFLTYRLVSRCFETNGNSSARFTANLFRFLIVLALARAVATGLGLLAQAQVRYWSDTATYAFLIVSGVGLGFGFFSMTTSHLTGELEKLANVDPLTQVFNRRAFLDICRRELDRSCRSGSVLSFLLLDLDHFKRLNDSFGHQAGDEALCASVECIQNAIRGIDTLCRWGGEEFAILLPNASEEAALLVAARIQQNFRNLRNLQDRSVSQAGWRSSPLTVSIGTSTGEGLTEGAGSLLSKADVALYEAKHSGRNRVVAYSTDLSQPQGLLLNL